MTLPQSLAAPSRLHSTTASLSQHAPNAVLAAATLASAYALKRHYSAATADDLGWILAPTAWLTGTVLDHEFVRLPDAGYLSQALSILITPACAGVNFLVVAFVVSSLGFGRRFGALRQKALWVIASAGLAWVAAVLVNATRIALSVHVAHGAARELDLSFYEAHRLLGVATYLGALVALVFVGEAAFGRLKRSKQVDRAAPRRIAPRSFGSGASPTLVLALLAYVSVTLGVPLLRGAATAEYRDHALVVGGASIVIGAIALFLQSVARLATWIAKRMPLTGPCPRAPKSAR